MTDNPMITPGADRSTPTLAALLDGLLARVPPDLADRRVTGLTLDSRGVEPGDVFVALAGGSRHGLEFAGQALEAGAAAVVYDPESETPEIPGARDEAVVPVPGLAGRLHHLARAFWGDPSRALRLHGITGTNGKSSCAWLIAQATGGAMVGTLGAGRPGSLMPLEHTTPDLFTLYRLLAGFAAEQMGDVALEVSSHALDQGRVAGLSFETVVFTNLGEDHRDYHRQPESYGRAKSRLFSDYPARRALISADDDFGRRIIRDYDGPGELWAWTLEDAPDARLCARIRSASADGMELELTTPAGVIEFHSGLLGGFNAANLLITAGVLTGLGRSTGEVVGCLTGLEPVPGRMNRLPGRAGQPDVVIDYAHSPDALEAVLAALAPLCRGQLWCVFGCGGERDREKRPRMGAVAERVAHRIILTDDNPRAENGLSIIREIQSGMARPDRARVIRDRASAIETAMTEAGDADLVLVAGKGHETSQEIDGQRRAFSDFEVVSRVREAAA